MLNKAEGKQIKKLLKERFSINDLKRLLSAASQDWESIVPESTDKLTAITLILDDAGRNSWTRDLLDALIDDLEERLAPPDRETAIAAVRDIGQCLRLRWGRGTAMEDPFKSCFVRGGWPFVNRPQVSRAFAGLAEPAGFRIAVINGGSGTGKTYSKELPQFVAEIHGNQQFKVYYRDLSEGDYGITAEKLVQSILWSWGQDLPLPAQLSQSSSYATELSEWLTAKAPRDQTWWIIIDGIAKIKPRPGLLNFLMALAKHITDSSHDLRLVLLDLGDDTPLPSSAESLAARVRIDQITSSDLVEHYFRMLHLAQAPGRPFDDALMSSKAQSVLEQALGQSENGGRPDRLKEILLDITRELGFG